MAHIYPPIRPSAGEHVSQAERDVLDALAAIDADWYVIHSLWMKTHKHKLIAEADFVLITDRAVLVLEVKGGEVWRDDVGWNFRTNSGRSVNVKREGPFEQVQGAYYALKRHLANCGRADLFDGHVWGHGVILPDCVLHVPVTDPAVDPAMVLDQREFPRNLVQFVSSLTDYWIRRIRGESRGATIPSAVRGDLLRTLRPHFELVAGVGAQSAHVERELLRLTGDQLRALDFMSAEKRNILLGQAGTGKTVLLVEQARRQLGLGKSVLFLCFNRLLGQWIATGFTGDLAAALHVGNYHQVVSRLCTARGIPLAFSDSWPEFCVSLSNSAADLVSSLGPEDLYDYLVVDEGQDLMNDEFMGLIDCLLKGGLAKGSWLIACDVAQAIFKQNFNEQLLDRLIGFARRTPLSINCRNSRQIAAYVHGFSGQGVFPVLGTDGEVPVIRYYDGRDSYLDLLKRVVNDLVQSFVKSGIPASDIILLYANREALPDQAIRPGFFLRAVVAFDPAQTGDHDRIRYASAQSFKGLEGRAIVLIGLSEFEKAEARGLFYVAASRARTNLRILLPRTCDHARKVMPVISEILSSGPSREAGRDAPSRDFEVTSE